MEESITVSRSANGMSDRTVILLAMMIFIGQIGLLAWLGGGVLPERRAKASPGLELMQEIFLVPDYGVGAPFSDPTLFTRPNRRGFSGAAWRDFEVVDHQLIDWDEPSRPLPSEPDDLGKRFRSALPNHLAFMSDIPAKRLARPMEVSLPPLAMRATSDMEIRGNLAKRSLVRSITVPGLSHGEALQRTRVRIGVNADGYVVSAKLPGRLAKPGSQQAAADQRALSLLRGIRFEPLTGPTLRLPAAVDLLDWGEAVFHWQTVKPPEQQSVAPSQ